MIVQTIWWRIFALVLLFMTLQVTLVAGERLSDARAAVSQWVELEKTISKERLAWDEKKRLLENLVAVAEAEIATLKDQLESAKALTDKTEARRAELVGEMDENTKRSEQVKTFLDQFESRLRNLYRRLPRPLMDKIAPIMERLPDDPKRTSTGNAARMQAVVGMMAEMQQFDKTVTTGEELLTLSNGETREIYTIHFGLGASYYVTSDRAEGGIGMPAETGWKWESKPQLAARIDQAIALAKGHSMEAGFLSLPVDTHHTQR